jgi:hypothetical protein
MYAIDDIIPQEVRLSLYLATRFLQELKLALQLIGIPSTYIRPGIDGVILPRLYVGCTEYDLHAWKMAEQADEPSGKADGIGELDNFVCALPFSLNDQRRSRTAPELEWWFTWWGDQALPICQARDMRQAAQVIVEQLFEKSV